MVPVGIGDPKALAKRREIQLVLRFPSEAYMVKNESEDWALKGGTEHVQCLDDNYNDC